MTHNTQIIGKDANIGAVLEATVSTLTCTLQQLSISGITVAQKTALMFAYYVETHVLLSADIIKKSN